MIRIGLIGFGNMGKTHAFSVAAMPFYYSPLPFEAKIVGVVCTKPETTAAAAKAIGCEAYSSVEALISDPEIDLVDICTPNDSHEDLIALCVKYGKHIYCEKPLCPDAASSYRAAKAVRDAGLVGKVVFHNRFFPATLYAKKLLASGRLGDPLSFRFAYLHASCTEPEKKAGWKQCGTFGGGVLNDLGSHVIDLMISLLGPVASVSALTQIGYPQRKGIGGGEWATDAEEAAYLNVVLKNGAMGTVEASKLAVGTQDDLRFEIYCKNGALRFSMAEPGILEYYDRNGENVNGFTRLDVGGRYDPPGGAFPSPKAPVGWLRAHAHSYYTLLSSLRDHSDVSPDFFEGAYVQAVIDAAKRSAGNRGAFTEVAEWS